MILLSPDFIRDSVICTRRLRASSSYRFRAHTFCIRSGQGIRYRAISYDMIRYDTIRYDTIRYSTIQYEFGSRRLKTDNNRKGLTVIKQWINISSICWYDGMEEGKDMGMKICRQVAIGGDSGVLTEVL